MRERARERERAEPPRPAKPPDAPAATVLVLQRSAGNQGVTRALAARRQVTQPGRNGARLQRMQTTVPVQETEEKDDAGEGEAEAVEEQGPPLSPHDQKVASDLAKINAPDDGEGDLDPEAAGRALAALGLEEPPALVDEIAVMEETLRLAVELGIDAKAVQGYKKRLQELKVDRAVKAQGSAEEKRSVLQESEGLGLSKAVLDPLRTQVLTLDLQQRCGALRSQAQPLQIQAKQLLGGIAPLKLQIDRLHSVILLHPWNSELVIGCREDAADLRRQVDAAHKELAAVLAEFDEIVDAATADLPQKLPALKKHQDVLESMEHALEEQRPILATAQTTHKDALAADGAISDLSSRVTVRFQKLCAYYSDQEPYLVAYNTTYADECLPYFNQVMQLKALAAGVNAQTLTVQMAKQIVKAAADLDFTVKYDDYLKELIGWYYEGLAVAEAMGKVLTYKKGLFATYPTKGRIGIQALLALGHIRLRHKGTYRDTKEKQEKKGHEHGPFSRSFWVSVTTPQKECDWVIHVHYISDDPSVIDTQGNIGKMHAKTKDAEPFKGGALADWTGIALLQTLVTNTAKVPAKDEKIGI